MRGSSGLKSRGAIAHWTAIIVCAFWGYSYPAQSSVHLGLELSSFLLSSNYRNDGWSSLAAGVDLESEGPNPSRLDARAYLSFDQTGSLSVHLPAAYLAMGSTRHEFNIGRRAIGWSRMDERWGLGVFNPRFLWNPLIPETDALTGAFYRFESSRFRLTAFATGISVPELGHNVAASGGRLRSSSPWFVPPPTASTLMGKNLDIEYSLVDPDMSAALLRPGALLKAEWLSTGGTWAAVTGGKVPMHQADLALDAYFDLSDTRLHADLLPRFGSREVYLFEGGYSASDWSMWLSLLHEIPSRPDAPEGWITRPIGPATLISAGSQIAWHERLRFGTSVLWVNEAPKADAAAAPIPGAGAITLPGRFPFERALLLEARWTTHPRAPEPGLKWMVDLERPGGLLVGELNWRLRSRILISTGFEHPYASGSTGWFGSYRGQDRVWGRVGYEL